MIAGGIDGADRWARMVAREHLVLAWPPRAAGDPVLTGIFEDLD